jgi:uncharacterized membrane protein
MRAQNASTAMALEKKVRKIKNDSRTTYFERVHLHDVLELVPLLVLVLVLLLAVAIFFVVIIIVIVIVSVLAFVAGAVVLKSHNRNNASLGFPSDTKLDARRLIRVRRRPGGLILSGRGSAKK